MSDKLNIWVQILLSFLAIFLSGLGGYKLKESTTESDEILASCFIFFSIVIIITLSQI